MVSGEWPTIIFTPKNHIWRFTELSLLMKGWGQTLAEETLEQLPMWMFSCRSLDSTGPTDHNEVVELLEKVNWTE